MVNKRKIKRWVKERDEVVLSLDIERFKAFYTKWQALGVYDPAKALPSDDILEIALRKAIVHMESATEEQKNDAAVWLTMRGYIPR